jgi:hypothetical protein
MPLRDNNGRYLFRHIPDELIRRVNQQELSVDFTKGSRLQLLGSDNMDSIIGSNPVGVAYTEFAIQSPMAYDLFKPILLANKGFAIFNSTPRGQNHFHKMFLYALDAKDWFVSYKTADDVYRDAEGEDGDPVITEADVQRAIAEGMDPDLVKQEFYCDWRGYATGSYYGALVNQMRDEGRISVVPWDQSRRVFTAWDVGVADATAIIFAQCDPAGGVNVIDYIEVRGQGLAFYLKEVLAKPYKYSNHYAPHDIQAREWQTGRSRISMAADLGIRFRMVPNVGVQDGIDSARAMLPMTRIDLERGKQLVDALANYHRAYDEKTNTYSKAPVHDSNSHGADAFRYLSLIIDDERDERRRMVPPQVVGLRGTGLFDDEANDTDYKSPSGRVSF